MFEAMRRRMKMIFLIVVASFVGMIVFQWGMNYSGRRARPRATGVLGKINGEKISYEQFRRALQQIYLRVKEASRQEPDMDELIDRTWNEIVDQILISQEIERRKITVSNKELVHYIRNQPPEFVQDVEAFQTDGKFDLAKYQQFLDDPSTYEDSRNKQFLLYLEELGRRALRVEKLRDQILGTVKVTSAEVRKDYVDRNEKVRVEYVFAGPETFRDVEVEVTEEEIQIYYDEHQDEFREEAKRRCEFVFFEKKPSASDEERVRAEIEEVLAEVRAGADFSELAKENSDDEASALQGGNLGWFGHGHMVEPFDKAAFALKVGQISEPVRTSFGWHIIKLLDRKKEDGQEKIRASHILLEVKPSPKTIEDLKGRAEAFASEAREGDFNGLAESEGLEVRDTGFFRMGSYIPGIGRARPLVNFAFTSRIGEVSRVYEDKRGFSVLQLKESKEEGIRPLREVREEILKRLKENRRKQLAKTRLEEIAKRIAEGATLEEAAKAGDLEVKSPKQAFSRTDYVPQVGSRNEFIGAAFRLEVGQTSGVVQTDRGYYIIKLLERQPINEEQFQREREEIRKKLLSQRQYEAYTNWFADLKQKAKIVDNRDYFYGPEAP